MSAWKSQGGATFKCRVYDRHGTRYVRSLKTTDPREALEIAKTMRWLRKKRKWVVLDLIIARQLKPTDAHDAHIGGYLTRVVRETIARQKQKTRSRRHPLLATVLAEWTATKPSSEYIRQVSLFVDSLPRGSTIERFRRKDISEYLGTLRVVSRGKTIVASGSTRNRYRVALFQFGRFLVEREYLTTNPVRDVRGAPENKPRMIFHSREQAKALIGKLEGANRKALEAFMAGCGVEWQVIERVRRRDIIPETRSVWAQGTKTKRYHAYRMRWVVFTEDWAWDLFWAHAETKAPDELLFEVAHDWALELHKRACKAAEIEESHLHDWRHTYAIYTLADGIAPQVVKRQLGHSPNSTELERVYQAWIPKRADDYRRPADRQPTAPQPPIEVRPPVLPVPESKGGPPQWN